MISYQEIALRLLIAALLGAVVGYERERQSQVAGWRTHIIVVVGSSLAMMLSIYMATGFHGLAPNGDPARLAAQVISGMGFLGAGAILRFGPNVKGLTTAASLWSMAIVGLAVGAGSYFAAILTTLILLVALLLLNTIETRYFHQYTTSEMELTITDRDGVLEEIRQVLEEYAVHFNYIGFEKNVPGNWIKLTVIVKILDEDQKIGKLAKRINLLPGVIEYKMHG